MSNDLPEGWETPALGEIAQINPRHPKGLDDSMVISFAPMAALSEGKPDFQFLEERTLGQGRKNFTHFAEGDVLFAKITPCMENGKGAVATGLQNGLGCGTTELHVVRPLGGISSRYIYRFLAQSVVRREAKEHFTGTAGQARVPVEFVKQLQVPLAPLAEQQRIVDQLEQLIEHIDSSKDRLARIPTILKRFRQSVLAAACSGRLTADWREENPNTGAATGVQDSPDGFPTLPETWRWSELATVCANVIDCPHSTPKWAESGRLCVRTTNFKPGFLDLSDVRYVSNATFSERVERLRPQPGDILYSREGGILGIACMIPPKVDLCLGQRMMLLRAKSDFTASFLMHWLNSPAILRRVRELTGGSASPHLNVRDIKKSPTPVPPLPEQQEIVRRVADLFALADRIEEGIERASVQVHHLTPSLLAKAFRGEIVPTEAELAVRAGREYETAEQLLSRISNSLGSNSSAAVAQAQSGNTRRRGNKHSKARSTQPPSR